MNRTAASPSHVPLDGPAIAALAGRLAGSVHRPGEAAYDEACRIWNAMITRRPALVVRPEGAADVAETIRFAQSAGLPLSVRGGGHNVAGAALCDGGITIDMSQRRGVEVDPAHRTVRVEPGATWADVDRATLPDSLIVPSGIVSTTGVAGFTLGAGFGWTSRKFGFAADNLLSAEIVTADGEIRRASAGENPDLFWALCGGGGNFGVVTSFAFRAHAHGPQALCGMIVHPFGKAQELVRLYREVTATAPDELTCLMILRNAPPAPFLPEEIHGKPIAAIAAHWNGRPEDGEAAMRAIKSHGNPIADAIAPKDFAAFQAMLDSGQPFGRRYYWKSDEVGEVSDGLIDTLVDRAAQNPSPFSAILMMHMDGAPARMDPDVNAAGIRGARYGVVVQASWEDAAEDRTHIDWARQSFDALRPWSSGVAYVNFLTEDEGESRLRDAYGAKRYDRLRQIKRRYDPDNLFRGNLNIPPAE